MEILLDKKRGTFAVHLFVFYFPLYEAEASEAKSV